MHKNILNPKQYNNYKPKASSCQEPTHIGRNIVAVPAVPTSICSNIRYWKKTAQRGTCI